MIAFHHFVDTSAGTDACWPWTGSRNRYGYGRAKVQGVEMNASRAAYIAAHGPIADALLVRHDCDNPPCCNPRHLRAGSQLDNMADRRERGGYPRGFTPRDMGADWPEAFTYAVVFGWDDPDPESDAMAEMAARWDWDEPMVEFLRDAHRRFQALADKTEADR